VSVLSCSLINADYITNNFMMRMYEDHHNDTSTAVVVQVKRGVTACAYMIMRECLAFLDQKLASPFYTSSGYSGDSFLSSY